MAREEPQHPDELKELERELRALVPRGPKIDTARLMYLAGQASMSPVPPCAPPMPIKPWGRWGWPAATGLMTLVALWLGAMLIVIQTHPDIAGRPEPEPHQPPRPAVAAAPPSQPQIEVKVVDAAGPASVQGDASYLRDRQTALDQGVEALPQQVVGSAPAGAPGSYGSLRNGILRERRSNVQRSTMWTEFWK